MVKCPSCAQSQEPRLTCRNCGAPLPVHLDCFAALGLPRKLGLDLEALEETYHELGRKVHPDHFASSPAMVRSASLVSTALLTRSYRTLRDPISRGLYWLELSGEKLSDNNKRVPPDLAETVFDIQEQLSELRAARCVGEGKELIGEIEHRRAELADSIDAQFAKLDANFKHWDANGEVNRAELTTELKSILSRIAYLRTLLRDVDRELHTEQPAELTRG
jgi:molecular chaperone HscB